MIGTDFFASVVKGANDAIICTDLDGIIVCWNPGAEQLFGHEEKEILGKSIFKLLDKSCYDDFAVLISRLKQGEQVSSFNAKQLHKNNSSLNIDATFSPIKNSKDKIIGFAAIMRKAADDLKTETQTEILEKTIRDFYSEENETNGKKRTFEEIRNKILFCLTTGQKTINQVSTYTSINWKTVENHLTYLLGKGFVFEVFKSDYVRIFDISQYGKEHLMKLKRQNQNHDAEKMEEGR